MWCSDNNDAACSWLDSSQQEQNTLGSGSYGDSTAYNTSESSPECFQQEALNDRDTSENPDNFTPPMTSTKTSEKSNVLDDPTSATSYGTYRNSSVRSDRSSTRSSTGSGHEADTESVYSGSTTSSVSSTASSSEEELWSCFYDHQDAQAGLGGGFVSLCPLVDDLTPGSETEEEMFNAVSPMPSEEVMIHFFQGMEMGSDDVFYSDDECQQPPSRPHIPVWPTTDDEKNKSGSEGTDPEYISNSDSDEFIISSRVSSVKPAEVLWDGDDSDDGGWIN